MSAEITDENKHPHARLLPSVVLFSSKAVKIKHVFQSSVANSIYDVAVELKRFKKCPPHTSGLAGRGTSPLQVRVNLHAVVPAIQNQQLPLLSNRDPYRAG